MEDGTRSALLHEACDVAAALLADLDERHGAGDRPGQYALDLVVDGPVIDVLHGAGLGILSEEAGAIDIDRPLTAILDPVDGSTNASLHLPWYATSICIADDRGPLHSLVLDHVSTVRYEARRGAGATIDGVDLPRVRPAVLGEAVVAVNGAPPSDAPWAQFRCFGAAALDLCAVASGRFGGYVDFDDGAHGVWDYLGAQLVCEEAGVLVVDAFGRDLFTLDPAETRTPIAATSAEDLRQLVALRVERTTE